MCIAIYAAPEAIFEERWKKRKCASCRQTHRDWARGRKSLLLKWPALIPSIQIVIVVLDTNNYSVQILYKLRQPYAGTIKQPIDQVHIMLIVAIPFLRINMPAHEKTFQSSKTPMDSLL